MRAIFILLGVAFFTAALLWPFLIRDFIYFTLLPEPVYYPSNFERILRAASAWIVDGKGRMIVIQACLGAMSFFCFFVANFLGEDDGE